MAVTMFISDERIRFLLLLLGGLLIQSCSSFLWYSPISKTQTLEDCLLMKESRSPFYPSYCDRLLKKYSFGVTTTPRPFQARTEGWGWTGWGEWAEDACPEVCGRRCRLRQRACGGPYEVACKNKGRAYQFEDCPALEEDVVGDYDEEEDSESFQRTTRPSNRNKDFLKRREQQQRHRLRPASALSANRVVTRRKRRRRKRPR